MKLVVVGGGVSGLAGAYQARLEADRLGVPLDIALLEAEPRFGGKVLTDTDSDVPIDWGPDSFLAAKPGARELAAELGLDLVAPNVNRTYLLLGGRLRPLPPGIAMGVPTGLLPLAGALRLGIVGPAGALRAALEPLLPREDREGATIAEVFRRRLGRQVTGRLVAPLVTGVFGAPPDEVSMEALPQLAHARSLVLAMARRPPRGGSMFLRPVGGMGAFVEALAERLRSEDLRTESPAASIARDGSGYRVVLPKGEKPADAILLALPAPQAAGLLGEGWPDPAARLAGIPFAPAIVAHLVYSSIGRPLDASGYLVAPEEGGIVTACSWLTSKWPHLGDGMRLRAMVTDPRALDEPDDAIASRVASEVGRVMLADRAPTELRLHRWTEALPVRIPGHGRRVLAAESGLPATMTLAGAARGELGVPDCIRTAREAARRLVATLAG